MTSPRRGEGTGGVELAKGYIALSVRYGSAMSQINSDFASVQGRATEAGTAAGRAHAQAMGQAVSAEAPRHMDSALLAMARKQESGLQVTGQQWGRALANDFAASFGRTVGTGMERVLRGFSGLNTPANAERELRSAMDDLGKSTNAVAASTVLLNRARSSGNSAAVAQESIRVGIARENEAAATKKAKDAYHEWANTAKNFTIGGAVGTGTVRSLERVHGALDKAGEGFARLGERGRGVFESLSAHTMGLVSGPMAALLVAGTSIGGAFEVLKGGFERLEKIEHTKEQMRALGMSGEDVKHTFDSINESVKGTAFSLTDMLGVAQRAVNQGIKPGPDLVNYLKSVENASALTHKSVDEVGQMLDRLRTRGSATMREMTTFTAAGLPMATWLKKDLGLSDQAYADFIKHHKLTYQVFMDELNRHTADGAEKMRNSIEAQSHLLGENLKSIGSAVLEPFFGSTGGGLAKLNDKLKEFNDYIIAHQPQIVEAVGAIAHAFELVAQGAGRVVAGVSHLVGNILHSIADLVGATGHIETALGDPDKGNKWVAIARDIRNAGDGVQHFSDQVEHWSDDTMAGVIAKTDDWSHKLAGATDAVHTLQKADAEINENGEIILKDNTPEVRERLDKVNLKLNPLPDGTFKVVPLTEAAAAGLNSFREEEGKKPVNIKTQLDQAGMDATIRQLEQEFSDHHFKVYVNSEIGAPGLGAPSLVPPPGPPPDPANLPPWLQGIPGAPGGPPRADGAIQRYASGKLPSQAIVQSAVPGLVQWAEPSTGGEAFIPLHPAKRSRSLEIWKQTGKLLGVGGDYGMYSDKKWSGIKMDDGGFTPGRVDKFGRPIPDEKRGGKTGLPILDALARLFHDIGIMDQGGIRGGIGAFDDGGFTPGRVDKFGRPIPDEKRGGKTGLPILDALARLFHDIGIMDQGGIRGGIGAFGPGVPPGYIVYHGRMVKKPQDAAGWAALSRFYHSYLMLKGQSAWEKDDPNAPPDDTVSGGMSDRVGLGFDPVEQVPGLMPGLVGTGNMQLAIPGLGRTLTGAGYGAGGIRSFADGAITSGVLQVIWANPVTGQKVGEAGGNFVGPGTTQPGYYNADWGGHTGHVHTSFATGPSGQPYGLPKGSDIRQGQRGFPAWVYQLGAQFGLDASTYAGHQESSGYNRGIDWWPHGHADMSGASYNGNERARLQSFAQFVSTSGVFAAHGGQQAAGNRPREAGGVSFGGGGGGMTRGMGMPTGFGAGGGGMGTDLFGGGGGGSFPLAPGGSGGTGGSGGGGGAPAPLPGPPSAPGGGSGPVPGMPLPTAAGGLGGITDPVTAIVAEGRRRGYSDADIAWIVADSIGESSLNPEARNGDHRGLFQQDSGYPGRNTLGGQVTGFYDRLDQQQGGDIGSRITGVEKGGYGPDWIQAHLGEAQSRIAGVAAGLGSGRGRGRGGVKPLTSQQQEEEDRKEREIQDRINDLGPDIQEAQERLDELTKPDRDKPAKPYEVERAKNQVERLKRELEEKKSDLQTAKTDFGQKAAAGDIAGGAGGTGGTGGGEVETGLLSLLKEENLEKMGDIGSDAMIQSFLPPGFINPFGTTAMHAGSVIFNFLGALMSGKGSNVVKSITGGQGLQAYAGGMVPGGGAPVTSGGVPAWGSMPSFGGGDGGGPTVDASQHYEGASFGYSQDGIRPVIQNNTAATQRAVGTIDSQRIWNT